MNESPDILKRILARKVEETAARRAVYTIRDLETAAKYQEEPRGFCDAIVAKVNGGTPAVIAELKKASPSKGIICVDFQPELLEWTPLDEVDTNKVLNGMNSDHYSRQA